MVLAYIIVGVALFAALALAMVWWRRVQARELIESFVVAKSARIGDEELIIDLIDAPPTTVTLPWSEPIEWCE